MIKVETEQDQIEQIVHEGLDLGLKRKIAALYEIAASPSSDMDNFARGLVLAVERYEQALTLVDELFHQT